MKLAFLLVPEFPFSHDHLLAVDLEELQVPIPIDSRRLSWKLVSDFSTDSVNFFLHSSTAW